MARSSCGRRPVHEMLAEAENAARTNHIFRACLILLEVERRLGRMEG